MLLKRARELLFDLYHSVVSGPGHEIIRSSKIVKAIDDNNIFELRDTLNRLDRPVIEDYLRRPVDSMRRTPLHFAAWAENYEILESLLDYVDDVDVEDKTGATPMMFVIGSGQNCLRKLHLLMKKHPDVNRKDKSGWTLLHAAVHSKNKDNLEFLLSNGGNIHIVDAENRSLLHIACDGGDLALVKYLVEKGVSLKMKDKNGWTPLHIACGPADDYELVHYLIQHGADPTARDFNQCTPLHLATQFQAKKVQFYLRAFDDLSTDSESDDSSSDYGITNETYESDNVFESDSQSNRLSQKSNRSIRMTELAFNQERTMIF